MNSYYNPQQFVLLDQDEYLEWNYQYEVSLPNEPYVNQIYHPFLNQQEQQTIPFEAYSPEYNNYYYEQINNNDNNLILNDYIFNHLENLSSPTIQPNSIINNNDSNLLSNSFETDSSNESLSPINMIQDIKTKINKDDNDNINKPYSCDVCSRAFLRNHDLTRHKKIHGGIRKFKCDTCDKRFYRKDLWRRHCMTKKCRVQSLY